ncbi:MULTISPECIES: porin [unclassified Bradyrhizobium]|uniref:porin n=1 Tax=unclassified Bradyrhizobium TaxID=2631580 RepID=UPI001BA9E74C|nr:MULTISPECIES: porin [unclassified Bradyrhizobium]MBR1207218.1 porin [Bradyrhizobium sp. AUGA SZCCT0124]MBR1313757.1 porin [Bradyrhizobium sp. AUGA SZCCT0051]MBR1343146.1 porin [Bradyrhizobium sp. AUGA SZCCT0105]MBR1357434.1 porin [Bradyrhizobium sp. AUGA SZCCT0045]
MKLAKSLILGSAAALVAVGGAQAADLPVKAKAVEYVKVCSLYGPGFYYIPGTDTCIKLGGYVRADLVINGNSVYGPNYNGASGANNRFTNGYTWRSREDLNIDTRTATEYGVVRTYFDAVFTWTSDSYGAGAAAGSTIYSPIGTASAPNNAGSGNVAAGTVGVYYAFIQFAGFTMGKAVSQFAAPWNGYPGNNYDGLVGGVNTTNGVNQFTYTAQFGNGVSLALSAQDQVQYSQAGVNNLGAGGAYGSNDTAGTIAPDFIAALKVDQAWGVFQASIAAHDNHAAYYGGTELTGHPDDKWGWAGALALSIKNIPTGPGDTINIQGVYTDGATRYNIQDLASQAGSIAIYSGSNLPGAYGSVGFGTAPDTVFGPGGQQQSIKTWGMRGAYTHNWDPYWNTSIYGAYAAISYNDTSKALICGVGGVGGTFRAAFAGGAGVTNCNPDYNIAQIGVITRWTPVKNLTFSADVTYSHLDQKYSGVITTSAASVGKPAAIYELKDQDTVQMLLRAQRNW